MKNAYVQRQKSKQSNQELGTGLQSAFAKDTSILNKRVKRWTHHPVLGMQARTKGGTGSHTETRPELTGSEMKLPTAGRKRECGIAQGVHSSNYARC